MQLKKIEIENPPLNDWRNFIPCGAETLYHVTAYKTGYLHDVGVELVLTPIRDGEEATGWDCIEDELAEAYQYMADCWEMAENDYAYSFKKLS